MARERTDTQRALQKMLMAIVEDLPADTWRRNKMIDLINRGRLYDASQILCEHGPKTMARVNANRKLLGLPALYNRRPFNEH